MLEYVDGGDLLDYIMKHTEPGPGLGGMSCPGRIRQADSSGRARRGEPSQRFHQNDLSRHGGELSPKASCIGQELTAALAVHGMPESTASVSSYLTGSLLNQIAQPRGNAPRSQARSWWRGRGTFPSGPTLTILPQNILLTSDNPPIIKVADFGLAKMVDEGTALRSMVGTPQVSSGPRV